MIFKVQKLPLELRQQLEKLSEGDWLDVPAPDYSTIKVQITGKSRFVNGDLRVQGTFHSGGMAMFTLGKDVIFGSLVSDELNLVISRDEGGNAIIVDRNNTPPSLDVLLEDEQVPPNKKQFKHAGHETFLKELEELSLDNIETTVIDIMFVHSAEFASIFGGAETRINQLISFTNAAYSRSGIHIELRTVAIKQINFNNSATLSSTLNAATQGSGDFSSVPALRNQYGADLVTVLHGNPGWSASGLAWVNGDDANYGFSSVRLSPGCCDFVFAHEIGHNLGSSHERSSVDPQATSTCDSSSTFTPFSCGHGNKNNNWGTIMSRLNSGAAGFKFSNPDIECQGEPCGVATMYSNRADNRTSFNMSRFLVTDFRPTKVAPNPVPEPESPNPQELASSLMQIYTLLLLDD